MVNHLFSQIPTFDVTIIPHFTINGKAFSRHRWKIPFLCYSRWHFGSLTKRHVYGCFNITLFVPLWALQPTHPVLGASSSSRYAAYLSMPSTNAPSMGCFDIHITARPRHNTFNQCTPYGVLQQETDFAGAIRVPSTNAPPYGVLQVLMGMTLDSH